MSTIGWMAAAIWCLQNAACTIGKNGGITAFSAIFEDADAVSKVTDQHPTEPDPSRYRAFKQALRRIAIDLHCLSACVSGASSSVELPDFNKARSSYHWDDQMWMLDDLKFGLKVLSGDAAKLPLEEMSDAESNRITEFNERVDRWADLSCFALPIQLGSVWLGDIQERISILSIAMIFQ